MPLSNFKLTDRSLHSINILRGIAAFGVFWYHQQYGRVLAQHMHEPLFNLTDSFGSTYAVPLFFLISGFCIHLSNVKSIAENKSLNLEAYFIKRFKRIYPPYLIALLFSLFVDWITQPSFYLNVKDLFIHLFVLQGFYEKSFNSINLVFWTISIELAFYILYPIFFYLRKKYRLKSSLTIIFITSITSIIVIGNFENITLVERYLVTNLWFGWCMGAFIADRLFLNSEFKWGKFLSILYPMIAILYLMVHLNKLPYLITDSLNILLWIGPLVYICSLENWLRKHYSLPICLLTSLGLLSYSLYLLHQPLIALKNFVILRYFPSSLSPLLQVLGLPAIIMICWLHYLKIEKPFMSKKYEE